MAAGSAAFAPGKPALLFLSELRLPEFSDAVQALEHEPPALSGVREFRQGLDRTCLVQMNDEELLTDHFPELCEVGMIFRRHQATDFLQSSEAPVVNFPDRLQDISDGAQKSLNDATGVR